MKRVAVLVLGLIVAVGALAWADVDIMVYGSGVGNVEITEHMWTDFGEIHEYFYADGDWTFMKDVYAYEFMDYGGFLEYKSFSVDGYVNFYEDSWLYAPYWDPDYFEVGAFVSVYGEGLVFFEKYVDAYFDSFWWEGDLAQEVYVEGYLYYGDVYIGHTAWMESYYYDDQTFEFHVWTPTVTDHVYQSAFLWDGDFNSFGVYAMFYSEPFQINSVLDHYVW